MIAPFLEDISNEMKGRVTVAKLNIDENPQTPMKYGVTGSPTLMLFKNGQVAATKIGILLFLATIALLPYRVSLTAGVVCSVLVAVVAVTVFVAWARIQRFSQPSGG